MGYTHYFEQVCPAPTKAQWAEIAKAARKVVKRHSKILCHESDEPNTPATVNESEIFFNGKGEDGHEAFVLRKDQKGFCFCKTACKPYDVAVVGVLREVKKICPHWLKLESDGGEEVFEG